MAWIIFGVLALVVIGTILYLALDESFVKVEPGDLGLLLIHGRATDTVLEPGPHWVPALRRRMLQTYPSAEMSFSAGPEEGRDDTAVEHSGPVLYVSLGDRNPAEIGYTVRFALDRTRLRAVHERFGPEGIWAAVRDETARTLRAELSSADVTVESLVGAARHTIEQQLANDITASLAESGIIVTSFFLGDLGLGRAGEAIEAIARARLELEREQAEAEMRLARAQIDADLAPYIAAATDAALRYREVDSWRELARSQPTRIVMPTPTRTATEPGSTVEATPTEAAPTAPAEEQ
jgi:hypothetical protein